MNNTVKYLLEKEIRRWIVVTYDKYTIIDKSRVDVKKGFIRFRDCKVFDKLPLVDLGLSENDAKNLINHVALDASLSLSNHPIIENFKTK